MGVSSALRKLARFLEACEADERTVSDIEFEADPDSERSSRLTAAIELSLSTRPSDREDEPLVLDAAGVTEDGTLRLAFESSTVVPAAAHDVAVDVTNATVNADGRVAVTLVASVRTDGQPETDAIATDERVAETVDERTNGQRDSARGDGVRMQVAGNGTRTSTDDGETAVDGETNESAASPTGRSSRRVPPFRDPELLAEVYESCDTFAEMTEALGMDVTAETVRRYMIEHGIHQPNSYNTSGSTEGEEAGSAGNERRGSGDGEQRGSTDDEQAESTDDEQAESTDDEQAESTDDEQAESTDDGKTRRTDGDRAPVVLADGIGLPDDVTVDELIETVKRSNTIYEVTRDIGMDREEALTMLRELNLLDLVVGRLAEAERDISRDDVIDRLRQVAATH